MIEPDRPDRPDQPTQPSHPSEDLAAYALGILDPDDHDAVAVHLIDCAPCRSEVAALAGPVALLATLDLDDVVSHPAPEALLQPTVAAARSHPDRPGVTRLQARRHPQSPAHPLARPSARRLALVAAAIVVVAGVGVAVGISGRHSTTPPSSFSAADGAVRMTIAAQPDNGGTALTVQVAGLPEHERCRLVAIAADGSRHEAGTWTATYHGQAAVSEATEVARSDLRRLVLYDPTGRELVAVSLTRPEGGP